MAPLQFRSFHTNKCVGKTWTGPGREKQKRSKGPNLIKCEHEFTDRGRCGRG